MLFHSGDLPVAGGVGGEGGGGVVALQGFCKGETASSLGVTVPWRAPWLAETLPSASLAGVTVASACCCSCCITS